VANINDFPEDLDAAERTLRLYWRRESRPMAAAQEQGQRMRNLRLRIL